MNRITKQEFELIVNGDNKSQKRKKLASRLGIKLDRGINARERNIATIVDLVSPQFTVMDSHLIGLRGNVVYERSFSSGYCKIEHDRLVKAFRIHGVGEIVKVEDGEVLLEVGRRVLHQSEMVGAFNGYTPVTFNGLKLYGWRSGPGLYLSDIKPLITLEDLVVGKEWSEVRDLICKD
jgi:hypothetical protein